MMEEQYQQDVNRLSELINKYTGIPQKRILSFIKEQGVSNILSSAYAICRTESQRVKLSALFEFKNLYETIKSGEQTQDYYLNTSTKAEDYFKTQYEDKADIEFFSAAFLDGRGKVIQSKILTEGTIDETAIYIRELIKDALFYNSTKVIIAHNHPGGTEAPSGADIESTRIIERSMDSLEIKLDDHILIAKGKTFSFAEHGLVNKSGEYTGYTVRKPSVREQIKLHREKLANESTIKPKANKRKDYIDL